MTRGMATAIALGGWRFGNAWLATGYVCNDEHFPQEIAPRYFHDVRPWTSCAHRFLLQNDRVGLEQL